MTKRKNQDVHVDWSDLVKTLDELEEKCKSLDACKSLLEHAINCLGILDKRPIACACAGRLAGQHNSGCAFQGAVPMINHRELLRKLNRVIAKHLRKGRRKCD